MDDHSPQSFADVIGYFTRTTRTAFRANLRAQASHLSETELAIVDAAAVDALHANARLKLNRILLLELHAARRAGELGSEDDAGQFARFVERAQQPEFLEHLEHRYPPLRRRLQRALDQQRAAIERMLARFIADRSALSRLLGRPGGRLLAVDLGQGDLHAGGQAVARLSLEGGRIMYKPRALGIDAALENFLGHVFSGDPNRIRVPEVVDRGDYGWAAFIEHRYCGSEDELRTFYRGLGLWLGVLRLLGGTDIHYENLIAAGPVPVVVDVESLFAVIAEGAPSNYGQAHDLAQTLIRSSVLRTGIVPFRTPALGFDGVDVSAAGALPGEQPQARTPIIANEGTTDARLEIVDLDRGSAQNHPSPNPDLRAYWDQISEGFLAASARLSQIDANGRLEPLLMPFEGCAVRDIRRPTQVYAEIARMLWHPASLHDESRAIARARDLFVRNAAVVPIAPSTASEIAAEIDDLRNGDVPVFVRPLPRARIDAALADWRTMRIDLEELTIRSALVATELNRRAPGEIEDADHIRMFFARHPRADNLEMRRRKLAADAVERLLRLAVRGDDGTVTWITPETSHTGWLVQPVLTDLYFGLGGIAVALAGYRSEVQFGRADAVPGLDRTIDGALRTLEVLDPGEKPKAIGGFAGFGGQIWVWTALSDALQRPELIGHAAARAEALRKEGFDSDQRFDIIDGAAGVIVPLIVLAEATGNGRWLELAERAAAHLQANVIIDRHGARWPSTVYGEPIGGFAHGATGTGWALARLALTGAGTGAQRAVWRELSEGAFAFQDSLYDEELGNWLDQRQWTKGETFHTWCNGSVGIGLAAADLYSLTRERRHLDMLRRAVTASRGTWGASHTLCHGDFSLWELLVRAAELDPGHCFSDREDCTAQVVSAIEEHGGAISGKTRAAFTPGLMTGLAGAVHGLNRMHPACGLGSPLLFEKGPKPHGHGESALHEAALSANDA